MKTCTKCGEEKELGDFSPDKRKTDGHYARCKECRVEDCRKHREENREKVRESARKWAYVNKEHVEKNMTEWRKKNRWKTILQQSRSAAKRCGHLPCNANAGQIEAAFTGFCEICGVPEAECNRRLHMDHDHKTGEFRGFLCGKCNKAIGLFNDSEEVLVNALHFIMTSQIKQP